MPCKMRICIIFISLILVNTPMLSLAADKEYKELKFPLPNLSPLITNELCRCEVIVGACLYGNTIENKGILGRLIKGNDKLSIRIEGNILYFLSGASFELGEAKAAQFKIISGSDEEVMAIRHNATAVFGYEVDTFTLNKKTGLAVWTRTWSHEVLSGSPSAQSFYLKCK